MNVDSSVMLLIVQFAEISPSSPTISLHLRSAVQFFTRASVGNDARAITVNNNNKEDRAICKKKKRKYHSTLNLTQALRSVLLN